MRSSYENERKRGRRWLGKLEIYWHWHCDYNIVFISMVSNAIDANNNPSPAEDYCQQMNKREEDVLLRFK
jgi:hypothetical protein